MRFFTLRQEMRTLVRAMLTVTFCSQYRRQTRSELSATDRQRSLVWAQRLKRVFAVDIDWIA